MEDSVLFIGQSGEITVTDQDLVTRHSYSPEQQSETVESFVFSRSEAVFVPRRSTSKEGAAIVSLQKSGDSTRLRVVSVDNSGVAVLGDLALPSKLVSLFTTPLPAT